MNVQEMERRFFELKGKFDVGALSEDEFKAEIAKLQFDDKLGRRWMIGAQSGKWYVNEGARWIPGTPPIDESPSAPPPPEKTRAPKSSETMRTAQLPRATPPARARSASTLPTLPITGPLLIITAGIAALVIVLIAWLAIDLMVPGRPISSFFSGLTGAPSARSTPGATAIAAQPASGSNASALIAMGDTLLLQSRVDAAITQYASAAQITPTNPIPLTRWSRALAFRGQSQDALTRAQQAAQRAPNDVEANAQLCRAQLWSGAKEDALKTCEKAVQLDTKNVNAHAYLAEAYLHAGRNTDAFAQAQLALQLAPNNAEAQRAQAWVLTLQGQKEIAFAAWRQTVVLEPDLYFRHFEFAEALRVYLGNPNDAVAEYQKSLALYGGYIPAIHRLGLALIDANKSREAIPHLQRAITLDPTNAEGFAYLGIAFGKSNQCNQAIPYFDQALKFDPNNSIAQRGLADCKSGKSPELAPVAPPTVPLIVPTLVPPK